MRGIQIILLALPLAMGAGCRCADCDQVYAHWFWEDAEGTKAHFDAYQHVVMVRIDEDVFEDGGAHRLSLHHYQGTVERTYKGDWKVSEPIAFVQGLDYSAATTTNRCVGNRMVLLINEHTNHEFSVDTGDALGYDGQFRRVLECFFHLSEAE